MRKTLTEKASLSSAITEEPMDGALDPSLYLSVLSADLGIAGKVNSNGRIYEVNEFVGQNVALSERLKTEFVDGEAGHPEGAPTFDVPVRLVGVHVEESTDTAKARGSFAVVNTQAGRDILTLYKAGMPIGVSSRGSGILEPELIDEDSKYFAANQSHSGETVHVVKEFELDRYDLVRVPSAGTHVESTQEAREALARLTEAGFISQNQEDADMSDKKKESVGLEREPEIEAPAQEQVDIEAIRKEAFEAATEEYKRNDPLSSLNDEQKSVFLRIAEAVTTPDGDSGEVDLVNEVALLRQELSADRERAAINVQEYSDLREEVETLRKQREQRELEDAIDVAITSCTKDKQYGAKVGSELRALAISGVISSVDVVEAFSERLFNVTEAIKSDMENATGVAVIEAEDVVDDNPGVDSPALVNDEAPGLLNENFHEQIRKILEKDRVLLGKGC